MASPSARSATATSAPRARNGAPLSSDLTTTRTLVPFSMRSFATTEPVWPVTPVTTNTFHLQARLRRAHVEEETHPHHALGPPSTPGGETPASRGHGQLRSSLPAQP